MGTRLVRHPNQFSTPLPQTMTKDEELLDACSNLDFDRVENFLAEDADAGYQDPATGYGPLHNLVLAAHATQNVDSAVEILEYVLANGGVWMQGIFSISDSWS